MSGINQEIFDEGFATVDEGAKFLRISRSQMYELLRRQEIFSIRIGSLRRIPKKALVEYAMKCAQV